MDSEQVMTLLGSIWTSVAAYMPRIIAAIVILLLANLAGSILTRGLDSVMKRFSSQQIHEVFFRSLIRLVAIYLGTVLALNVLGMQKLALSVLAGGGVTAIVLGFAFREIGENFLAGIFLAFSRPFKVGDLINTEGIEGRVRNIELRYTHLRSDDGQDIYVPSSQLFSKTVINFTRDGLRRINFRVGIDYRDDAKAACALLLDTVKRVEGVLEKPGPEVTINALDSQYVEILVYYWQDVFDDTMDGRILRINVIDACRVALLENKYTVSADTTSNVAVSGSLQAARQAPELT